jgi:hypothetical protein
MSTKLRSRRNYATLAMMIYAQLITFLQRFLWFMIRMQAADQAKNVNSAEKEQSCQG